MRIANLFVVAVAAAGLLGCVGGGGIGNKVGDCSPGDACDCDQIGNCDLTCTGPGCHFTCEGTGNCIFTCEQGGCTVAVTGQTNASISCAGGGCTMDCANTGTCSITECSENCSCHSSSVQAVCSEDDHDSTCPGGDAGC